jgi:hypothetical protein
MGIASRPRLLKGATVSQQPQSLTGTARKTQCPTVPLRCIREFVAVETTAVVSSGSTILALSRHVAVFLNRD